MNVQVPAAVPPVRIAVLASGGGSNLQAIVDHFALPSLQPVGTIALVASNRADAGALARATAAGIATHTIVNVSDGQQLLDTFQQHNVQLLVLAGYLKLIPEPVVHAYANRMLNVHPALLPHFGGHGMYGQRVHVAVLESGARITGVTVHGVDEQFDRGPIVAQWPVPVLPGDTPALLAARVLQVEHWFYPRVIEAAARHLAASHQNGTERVAWPPFRADALPRYVLKDATPPCCIVDPLSDPLPSE